MTTRDAPAPSDPAPSDRAPLDTVVLDLDGTLVDSTYVHVLAWQAAFRDVGLTVAAYRIHRAIGMGGDRLVAAVAGDPTEEALGDELRARHPEHLERVFGAITATDGASELLDALREQGLQVVLATSGGREQTERLLELVDGSGHLSASATGSDSESTKPSGEVIEVALASVDASSSVVVGDATWDVRAAQDAGVPCIGLLSGGISEAELREAGAVAVHETPRHLAEHLRATGSLLP